MVSIPAGDKLRDTYALLKETVSGARRHDVPKLSAALAFYALFSLAPIVVITVSVAGLLLGSEEIEARVVEQAQSLIGDPAGSVAKTLVSSARRPTNNVIALAASLPFLLWGASRVFAHLNDAMQIIWETRRNGIKNTILNRLIGGAMVIAAAAAFWLSVLTQGALASMRAVVGEWWSTLEIILAATDWVVVFAFSVFLIALVFYYVPKTRVPWRAALVGGFLTSFLFLVGRFGFTLYINFGIANSIQGAMGSLLVVVLWAYYVSQIVFIGAEFTRAYAERDSKGG